MEEMSDMCEHGPDSELAEQLARIQIGPSEDKEEGQESNKRAKKKGKRPEMIRMRSLNGGDGCAKEEAMGEEGKSHLQFQEYELADDAIDELVRDQEAGEVPVIDKQRTENGEDDDDDFVRIGCDTSNTPRKAVGREELPVGVRNSLSIDDTPAVILRNLAKGRDKFSTFPRMKRRKRVFTNRISLKRGQAKSQHRTKPVPTRKTKDGTTIFYWCDAGRRPSKGDFSLPGEICGTRMMFGLMQ